MQIELENISKRYQHSWIFQNINFIFQENKNYVLLGKNGSGKSTLLQILAGNISSSSGKIMYKNNQQELISPEKFYQFIAFSAPYLELIEDFTLRESIDFHFQFVKKSSFFDSKILASSGLDTHLNKKIKELSSGLKQRVKLILAFYNDAPILLLDEPCMNLDESGIEWYQKEIQFLQHKKTIIISSNDKVEYEFLIHEKIEIEHFKK